MNDVSQTSPTVGATNGVPEQEPANAAQQSNSGESPELIGKLEAHTLAKLCPMSAKEELLALADNIAKNGLLNPAVLHEGKILDGRRRAAACVIAGVELRTTPLPDGIDPVEFVLAQNLHRRHLSASQRATVAAKLLPHYQQEAAERKRVLSGTRANADGSVPEVPATLPPPAECGEAREKAAKVAGAKPRYVSDAVRLLREAPELFKQVESGEITIPQAIRKVATQSDTTPPEQTGLTRAEFIAVLWDERFEDCGRSRRAPEKSYPAKVYPNIAFFRLGRTGAAKFGGGHKHGMKEVALFAVPVEPEMMLKNEKGVPLCKASCKYLSLLVRGDVPEPKMVPTQVIEGGFEGVLTMVEHMWPDAVRAISTASGEEPPGWQTIPRQPADSARKSLKPEALVQDKTIKPGAAASGPKPQPGPEPSPPRARLPAPEPELDDASTAAPEPESEEPPRQSPSIRRHLPEPEPDEPEPEKPLSACAEINSGLVSGTECNSIRAKRCA